MIPIIMALENVPLTRRTAVACMFREQRTCMKLVIFSTIPSEGGWKWMVHVYNGCLILVNTNVIHETHVGVCGMWL